MRGERKQFFSFFNFFLITKRKFYSKTEIQQITNKTKNSIEWKNKMKIKEWIRKCKIKIEKKDKFIEKKNQIVKNKKKLNQN